LLWFARVLSLPQVLHEAERHAVDEIVIAPGRPVTLHGDEGELVLGDEIREVTISDALLVMLAPEQQAELAVAGIVEFRVEGHPEWSLVAESGADGVLIRGRTRDAGALEPVGAPLDLPPLVPFDPDGVVASPALGAGPRRPHVRSTRWDVDVAGSMLEPVSGSARAEGSRHATGRYDLEHQLPPRVPSSPLDESIDFALVGRMPPTRELPDLRAERAPTMPRLPASHDDPWGHDALAVHAKALAPGTVAYVAGIGVGERLLRPLEDGFEVIDLDTWDDALSRPYEDLPTPGRAYLVRLEDPSRCLAWLLRRLEEGARVVVETRARTAMGARRALLGVEATPHVVQWLDAHPQLWLHAEGRTWHLERL
jgi:hypothetical protein